MDQSSPASDTPDASSPLAGETARPSTPRSADRLLSAYLEGDCAFVIVGPERSVGDLSLDLVVDGRFATVLSSEDLVRAPLASVDRLGGEGEAGFWRRWRTEPEGSGPACGANLLPEWTLAEVGTAYLYSRAGPDEEEARAVYVCPVEGRLLGAFPGGRYRFSALVGAHRCRGWAVLTFHGESGPLHAVELEAPTEAPGGSHREDYTPISLDASAPEGTVALSLEFRKGPTEAGADSFLFFTEPRLHLVEGETLADRPLALPTDLAVALFAGPERALHLAPIRHTREQGEAGETELELVDRSSGERLAQGRLAADSGPFGLQVLGLEGSVLVSRVARIAAWMHGVSLSLWADGLPIADIRQEVHRCGDLLRAPVPTGLLDGRPHLFEFKTTGGGRLLAAYACVTPDMLTSLITLAQQRSLPQRVAPAPAAEHRYLALARALGRLTRGDDAPESGGQESEAPESEGLESEAPESEAPESEGRALDALRTLAVAHQILSQGFTTERSVYPPLAFRRPDRPRVSVIIPVHDAFAITYNCLAALIVAGAGVDMEVVVVDDGSSDRTLELPVIAPGVVYVRNAQAQGFVGACNRGAEAASGEFLVFLNNDTEPTAGWIDELLFVFEQFDAVGLAGAKLVYPDGRLQDAGGIVWGSGDPWNYGRGGNPREPRFCYARQVDYLSGAAIMIPRPVWDEVGGFSEAFAPAYFEDTDLAFKVRATGRRTVFAPHALVFHYEGLSNGVDVSTSSGLKRFQEINRPKFKAKWAHAYADGGELGQAVDLAKDRGVAGRAIFFDVDSPKPEDSAGSYAAFQEIRLFQSLGYKVTFAPTTLNHLGRHTEQLQRLGVEVLYAPYFNSIEQVIDERAGEFDLAYITRHQTAERVVGLLRRKVPALPLLCNVADLHHLRELRRVEAERSGARALAAAQDLQRRELAILAEVDVALSYSDVEVEILRRSLPERVRVAELPWVVEPAASIAPLGARREISFLGGFSHAPNAAAVDFFAREVMPFLRPLLPSAALHVYGSNMDLSPSASRGREIVAHGFAPDLGAMFDACRVFVAPLTYGAGVKGKVLDCLAAGVPSVLSPIAAEGLPIVHGREALIVSSPSEWAEAVAALYQDDALWRRMSDAALQTARTRLSFEAGRDAMERILRLVGKAPVPRRSGLFARRSRPSPPSDLRQ